MVRFIAAALALAVLLGMASTGMADELKIGDKAPAFSKLESTDGKRVSHEDFKQDVLVVCITCNHCPVAVAYEDRIIAFAAKHAGKGGKVGFVAINVNNIEEDKFPAMKQRAKEKGFNFPYAYDPTQKIARDLGASVTPEFFVFNKERKLVYQGAMDDDMNPTKAQNNYVERAVQAALTNGTPPPSVRARGCTIKFEK